MIPVTLQARGAVIVAELPHPASTVVLVRHADGLQVYMVRRHDRARFMAGAYVFPGGRVDAADHLVVPAEHCDGVEALTGRLRDEPIGVGFAVAAVRELFEEAGILLVRRRGGAILPVGEHDAPEVHRWRRDLIQQRLTLPALAARQRLRIALDALAPCARWITPASEPRRFDTLFFLACAPEQQHATHDDHEASDGVWLRPAEAIALCLAGKIVLAPPTWTTLRWLSGLSSVDMAWAAARQRPLAPIQPCVKVRPDGTRVVLLPGDPLCPPVEGFAPSETQFVIEDGRWAPQM